MYKISKTEYGKKECKVSFIIFYWITFKVIISWVY